MLQKEREINTSSLHSSVQMQKQTSVALSLISQVLVTAVFLSNASVCLLDYNALSEVGYRWVFLVLFGLLPVYIFSLLKRFTHEVKYSKSASSLLFSGLFLHLLFDGLAVGLAFQIDTWLGLTTSLFVILHEIPHFWAQVNLFKKLGISERSVVLRLLIVSIFGLAAGVVLVYFLFKSPEMLGYVQNLRPPIGWILGGYFLGLSYVSLIQHSQLSNSKSLSWPKLLPLAILAAVPIFWIHIVLHSHLH